MIKALIFAGLSIASPSYAQRADIILDEFTNGQTADGAIVFSFETTDCVTTAQTVQTFPNGATNTSEYVFSLDAMKWDAFETRDYGDIGIAQIILFVEDDEDMIDSTVVLQSEDAEVRAGWADQGATCEGTTCAANIAQDRIPVTVAGPNASARAELVLIKLQAIADSCSEKE